MQVRFVLALTGMAVAGLVTDAGAIPPWARKYNMNCSGCHYPVPPRLNATGQQFRWAGYRMPDEIGENAEMDRVSNYLGTRFRFDYVYAKPSGQPASTSAFTLPAASIFYAGAFGKYFGGLLEVGKEEEMTEWGASAFGVWGSERSHGGFRVGQTHMLLNAGVAGFDRVVGINSPTPVGGPVTGAIPFAFAGDQAGVEAFYVLGRNRLSGQIFNGNVPGEEGLARGGKRKDFVLTDQILWDKDGGGLQATAYYGTVTGLDTLFGSRNSHFWRLGLSASKVVNNVEVLGGVVYGKDLDLPVGGSLPFTSSRTQGLGYWFSGQYVVPNSSLTFYGRYEFVDPDRDASNDGNRRYVLGGVLPVNLPEYLRLNLELWRDDPQSGTGGIAQNNLAAELMLAF
ncbi:MAG: hypothetical protein SGJ01_10075 [Gemmatimonadota bacterium]|nr:hypothetical protein [Gemmatimonadota bacterium]